MVWSKIFGEKGEKVGASLTEFPPHLTQPGGGGGGVGYLNAGILCNMGMFPCYSISIFATAFAIQNQPVSACRPVFLPPTNFS